MDLRLISDKLIKHHFQILKAVTFYLQARTVFLFHAFIMS